MSSELAPDVLPNHPSSTDKSSNQDVDGNITQIESANLSDDHLTLNQHDPDQDYSSMEQDLAITDSDRPSPKWQTLSWLKPLTALSEPVQQVSTNLSLALIILVASIGGVVAATVWGLRYLTALESNPNSSLNCQSKIAGNWQTPFGKVLLQEGGNQKITGKYEYTNLDRGKVVGELTGKVRNNVINFTWKEGAEQQGKGIFVFSDGCAEFYGSYGIGDSTNNFGNWQGYRINQ